MYKSKGEENTHTNGWEEMEGKAVNDDTLSLTNQLRKT
jgi:hypothetical protein